MDLEAIHAIAPDAKKVLVNARSTVEGDGGYEKIAKMMEDTERSFPGAVWSFSIGWGCDKLITAADLAPVRSALADAHANRAPRPSTPVGTWPAWTARAARNGRRRPARTTSAWTRSPRCRR